MKTSKSHRYFYFFFTFSVGLFLISSCSSVQTTEKSQKREKITSVQVQTPFIPQKEAARDFFIKGSALQIQGKFAEAILEFQQALRHDSASGIYYAIANNYYKLSKNDLAADYARKSFERDSTFLEGLHLLGEIQMAQYKIDDALKTYQILVEKEPSFQHKFFLARLLEFRNLDRAIEIYKEILENGEEEINALSRLAEIYSNRGETKEAIGIMERILVQNPEDAMITAKLMDAYVSAKEYEKGLRLLETIEFALSDGEVMHYYAAYGSLLLRQADSNARARECAQQYLNRTEHHRTNIWQTQLMSGLIAGKLRDSARVERSFQRAISVGDTVVNVPLQIAVYYLQENNFPKLADISRTYERRFPDDSRFPFFYGIALSRLDSNEKAASVLWRSVELDSVNADVWAQLGIVYNSLHKTEQSDSAYIQALRFAPDNALVNNNYAYSLSERGIRLLEARKMAEIALNAEPENASYLDTMGWIYFQLGQYSKAIEFLLQAITAGDASATVFEHVGDCYEKIQNTEKAREFWHKALEKQPNRNSVKERLNRLK